jgi:membrane-associated protein
MFYSRYLAYDIFGGIFWVGSMVLGGFFLGRSIPNISQRIHYVIAVVIVLSILPAIISILRAKRHPRPRGTPSQISIPEIEGK